MVKLTEGPRRQPIIDILLNRCHKLNLPGQTATVHVSAHRWESALNLTDRKQDYQPTQNYQLPPGYQPQEVRPQEYFSQVHHQQIHQDIAISRAPPPQWQPPQIDHSQAWQQTNIQPQNPEGQQPQCTESIDPDPRPDDQSAYMQCRSGSNFAACP
ncbi:hypothetical protein BKA80DRAFT_253366 [Phyllosticta citrichinensis]